MRGNVEICKGKGKKREDWLKPLGNGQKKGECSILLADGQEDIGAILVCACTHEVSIAWQALGLRPLESA